MTDTEQYRAARRRAKAKYSFFVHAAVYAAVMVLLILINVMTPGPIWFIWPMTGWGFAVALHGVSAFLLADRTVVLDAMTEHELRRSSGARPDEGQQ